MENYIIFCQDILSLIGFWVSPKNFLNFSLISRNTAKICNNKNWMHRYYKYHQVEAFQLIWTAFFKGKVQFFLKWGSLFTEKSLNVEVIFRDKKMYPIVFAALKGHIEFVQMITKTNFDMKAASKALCVAIKNNNESIVYHLISKGVNPQTTFDTKDSRFDYATFIKTNAIRECIVHNRIDIMKFILSNVEMKSEKLDIFMIAIYEGTLEMIKLLFESKKVIIPRDIVNHLHRSKENLWFLLRDKRVNLSRIEEWTINRIFENTENPDIIDLLLNDDGVILSSGRNALLHNAIIHNNMDFLDLLVKRVYSLGVTFDEKYLNEYLEKMISKDKVEEVKRMVEISKFLGIKFSKKVVDKAFQKRNTEIIILLEPFFEERIGKIISSRGQKRLKREDKKSSNFSIMEKDDALSMLPINIYNMIEYGTKLELISEAWYLPKFFIAIDSTRYQNTPIEFKFGDYNVKCSQVKKTTKISTMYIVVNRIDYNTLLVIGKFIKKEEI
jgi:hypothetical protein